MCEQIWYQLIQSRSIPWRKFKILFSATVHTDYILSNGFNAMTADLGRGIYFFGYY